MSCSSSPDREKSLSSSIEISNTLEYKSTIKQLNFNSKKKEQILPIIIKTANFSQKSYRSDNLPFRNDYLYEKQNYTKNSAIVENKNSYSDDSSSDPNNCILYSASESFTENNPKEKHNFSKKENQFFHFDSTTEPLHIRFVKKQIKENSEMWNSIDITDNSPEYHIVVNQFEKKTSDTFKFKNIVERPTCCCLLI